MRSVLLLLLLLGSCAPRAADPPSPVVSAAAPDDRWTRERGRYNRVYTDAKQAVHVEHPSRFMMDCLASLPANSPGRKRCAVDLGAGQGRNAIALARAGYFVSAIDVSDEGLAHIRRRAGELRLGIETVEADVYSVGFEPGSIDLAVAVFFTVSDALAESLAAAVAPGGGVIIEGYPGQCRRSALERQFAGWNIVTSETTDAMPDWFWGREKKPVPVARFFARKPAAE